MKEAKFSAQTVGTMRLMQMKQKPPQSPSLWTPSISTINQLKIIVS